MGDAGTYATGTLFHHHVSRLGEGAGSVDHVVEDDDVFVFHIADDGHLADHVGFLTLFIADHHLGVEKAGISIGSFGAAHIGGGDHQVVEVELFDIRYEEG